MYNISIPVPNEVTGRVLSRSMKYASEIYGVLHCYDRIISDNLQPLCYAAGTTQYLYHHGIRICDYGKQFAEPLRDADRVKTQHSMY